MDGREVGVDIVGTKSLRTLLVCDLMASRYEREREERIKRNRQFLESMLPESRTTSAASSPVAVPTPSLMKRSSLVKKKEEMQVSKDTTVTRRVSLRKRRTVSYVQQQDSDDANSDDDDDENSEDNDDGDEFYEESDEESDIDEDEDSNGESAEAEDVEDEEQMLSRAIALSLYETLPTTSKKEIQKGRTQKPKRSLDIDQCKKTERKSDSNMTKSAIKSYNVKKQQKKAKSVKQVKKSMIQSNPHQFANVAEGFNVDDANDIPDGPLIELFQLITNSRGGNGDELPKISRQDILYTVAQHREMIDVNDYTKEHVDEMIDAAQLLSDASESASGLDIQMFRNLIARNLPNLFRPMQ